MEIQIDTYTIKDYMKANHLTKEQMSLRCKISRGSLNKILSGNKNFRLTSLFKLARTMNLPLHEMFIH